MRIEFDNNGLFIWFVNHYTKQDVLAVPFKHVMIMNTSIEIFEI